MNLYHLTINTGDVHMSPRCDVDDRIVEMLRPFVKPGARQMPNPFKDYALVTATMPRDCGSGFIVYRKPDKPLVVCVMAETPAQHAPSWKLAQSMYLEFTDAPEVAKMDWEAPREPTSLPWLAVTLTGTARDMAEAADWLGDFERCMAWAILENKE
jgi:hypothetical protein